MQNEHELRRTVVAEMHLRRWPPIAAPCQIVQIVRVVEPGEREAEQDALAKLPNAGALDAEANPRHRSGKLGRDIRFGWERHSEASTLTLHLTGDQAALVPGLIGGAAAADIEDDQALPSSLAWALAFPGKVIRATRLVVVEDEARARQVQGEFAFDPHELVSCHIGANGNGARARIWSDFKLRPDGFGLVLVAANGMPPGDLSRTIQRLQELGNYRNLSLLGLPVAQAGWKVLDQIERQLNATTARMAHADVTDDSLLEEVTRLSIELATEATASDFRISATEAYATIVAERLDDLQISPCEGFQSLADFTQRRLLPAVRTCRAHRKRAEELAGRTAQFVSLFRSRIETRIENQNARLLASMERNADRQLRLQQLVEGFSVVALTYYGLGLLEHVLHGLEGVGLHLNVQVMLAIMTPVIALTIWLTVHRLRDRVLR